MKSKTEAKFDRSQEAVLSILDTLQDSYFEADSAGVITYVNAAFIKNMGAYGQEVVGRHFRHFVHRKSIRDIFENYQKIYDTGEAQKASEYSFTRKDGEEIIGEITVSPIIVGDEVVGTRALVRDITPRIKTEEALREATHNLSERVKELNCLYSISELVETPGITLNEIYQGTANLIPQAWQHPENTCARINLGEREFKTNNYCDSPLKQTADILVNGSKYGAVEVHYLEDIPEITKEGSPFLKEERNLINAIAKRLGQITERQRQADRMAMLYQVGLATTSSLDMDKILVTIYEQCQQVMTANVFFIALNDEEKKEITYPIFFDQGQRIEPVSVSLDTGLGGWIIRNQRPFLCDDLIAEADKLPIKMVRMGGKPTHSFVGVPLLGREGAIGALSVQSYRIGDYNEDDLRLLVTIAAQAAGAIQNAQLYEAEQVAKKRLELQNKEIQEQKDLLDGLLQNSPLAIVINDLNSKITVVNPAFEKLFGYSTEEAIGRDLDDILSTPEIVEEMRALSRKSLKEEQDAYSEGKRKRKDGTLVDVELFTTPYYIGDQQYGYMVFYNDISERQKAVTERDKTHASFRGVLDSLRDPYFEADENGLITYANIGFVNTVGYENRDDVIGQHFRHFTDRSGIRDVFKIFRLVFDTQQPAEPFEYRSRRKDGEFRIGDAYISPIIEENEVVGTRGVIRDITTRVRAEEALRVAKNEAETRSEELSAINRISEAVSHSLDVGTILQSVCVLLTGIFEVRNAGIGLLEGDNKGLKITAFHSINPEEKSALGMVLPFEGNPSSQEVIDKRKTVCIQDAQSDPRTSSVADISKSRGTKAIMIVPLLARGKAIGTIGLPAKNPDHVFSENEIELAETIASQIAAAIDNAQLYEKTESALDIAEQDLEIGRQIQAGFFPENLPEIPGWEISAHFHAARQVAGDFYDIFKFRKSKFTAFIIADVCDKGVGAALFMVLFRSLLRAFSETKITAANVQKKLLNIILNTNNFIAEYHSRSNMFATIFFGILDPEKNVLYYVNGGHDPPVLLDKDGKIIQRLMPTGPAVGMFPDMDFQVEQIQFNKGDFLVGYTDGVTDAKNNAGELFSEERLLKSISFPWTSLFSMVFELSTEIQNHIDEQQQFDDITLITFRRKSKLISEHHEICRPAEMNMLGELRSFVNSAAMYSGLNHEIALAFKLAADEICTNIIQYGYEGQEQGALSLSFDVENRLARLTIQDDGKYFSLEQVEDPNIDAAWDERDMGGLGIYFVKELMDNVSYNRDENGNIFILEKDI